MKLSSVFVFFFLENTRKNFKSKLVLVGVVILESKGL